MREVESKAEALASVRSLLFVHAWENLTSPALATSLLAVDAYLCKDTLAPLTWWTKDSEIVARHFVVNLATTFPADVISRWYAATPSILHGLPQAIGQRNRVTAALHAAYAPIKRHMTDYGDFYALAALLLLSAHSVRMALIALCVVVYFCGCTGLNFQPRHAFHLEFLGFWLPMFCLGRFFGAARMWVLAVKQDRKAVPLAVRRVWPQAMKRMGLLLLSSIILLSLPLWIARVWQHRQVERLIQPYRQCQLEPVPFEETIDDTGAFSYRVSQVPGLEEPGPARWLSKMMGISADSTPGFLTDFLAADFEAAADCLDPTVKTVYFMSMFTVTDCFNIRDRKDPSKYPPSIAGGFIV